MDTRESEGTEVGAEKDTKCEILCTHIVLAIALGTKGMSILEKANRWAT